MHGDGGFGADGKMGGRGERELGLGELGQAVGPKVGNAGVGFGGLALGAERKFAGGGGLRDDGQKFRLGKEHRVHVLKKRRASGHQTDGVSKKEAGNGGGEPGGLLHDGGARRGERVHGAHRWRQRVQESESLLVGGSVRIERRHRHAGLGGEAGQRRGYSGARGFGICSSWIKALTWAVWSA